MQTVWFALLASSICLEGLGRRYLPQAPSLVFYFLKDAVLIVGAMLFPVPVSIRRTVRYLYSGFAIPLMAAIGWTVVEIVNPNHESWMLALIGLRAYWLWWIAPSIIAGMLVNERQKRRAIYVLLAITLGVTVLAMFQFASPANSDLNIYSVVDGEEVRSSDSATVAATGRARVASTFSYLTGFANFCLLVPTLLLSIGLEAKEYRVRQAALGATALSAAVIPMSGSRSSVLAGAAVLGIMAWASGLFFTRVGRRVLIGGVAAVILAAVAFPDAIFGVESRFENSEETTQRFIDMASVLPPVALAYGDYPALGIGTGMQQNARRSMHIDPPYDEEGEMDRYLVELGPIGFLLVWTAKLGLVVGLIRGYRILKAAGRRGAAGAALCYAVLTMLGDLTFDHIWQALYFMGTGFILREISSVQQREPAMVLAAVPDPGRLVAR